MSDEPDCLVIFGGREYRVGGREVPRILEAVKREDALVSIIAKDGRRARVAPHAIVAVEECREEKPKTPGYGGTPIRTAVHHILDLLRASKLTQDEAAQISTYASQRVLP